VVLLDDEKYNEGRDGAIAEDRPMHVFSRPKLLKASEKYPDASTPLNNWFKIAEKARWANIHEVRADYSHADPAGSCTVFNIGGNKYRLITRIFYATDEFRGHVYVIDFLTHEEYDEEKWKKACDC
jgi:mRNA interferase HigB